MARRRVNAPDRDADLSKPGPRRAILATVGPMLPGRHRALFVLAS